MELFHDEGITITTETSATQHFLLVGAYHSHKQSCLGSLVLETNIMNSTLWTVLLYIFNFQFPEKINNHHYNF